MYAELAATGRFTADEINARLGGLDSQIDEYEKQIRANEAVVREERVTGAIASIIDDAGNVTEADLRKAVRNHPDYIKMSHTEREQFRAGVLAAAQADPARVRNTGIEANSDIVDNGDNLVRVATERLRADPVGQVLMDSERYKNEDNSINLDNFYADLELDSEDDIKDHSFWTYIGLSDTPSKDWKQSLRNKINKLSQETGLPPEVVMTIMRDQFQRSRFFQDSMDRRFDDESVRKAAPTFSSTARTEFRTKRNLIKKMEKQFESVERESQTLRQRIAKLELSNPDDPRIAKWREEDQKLISKMAEIAGEYESLLVDRSTNNRDRNRGVGGAATVNRRDPAVAGIVGRETPFQ